MSHKDNFISRFKNLNLSKEQQERQWKIHLDEQEEMERRWRIFEEESKQVAALAVSPGAAGGGGGGSAASVGANEVFIQIFQIEGSETWKYCLFNANGTKTDLLDTEVPSSFGLYEYSPPVHHKGFLPVFYDGDSYRFLFIQNTGAKSIMNSASIENFVGLQNYYIGDGFSIIFTYGTTDGIHVVYFDGTDYIDNFFENAISANFEYNWDLSTKDGKNLITIFYNDNVASTRLFDINGSIELLNTNSAVTYVSGYVYTYADFVVLTTWNNELNRYDSLIIYTAAGAQIQQIDLTTSNDYTNSEFNFYGNNKVQLLFYNNNQDDPWKIFNFNGNTSTLISTVHEKGTKYTDFISSYESLYPTNTAKYNPEVIVNTFYSYSGWVNNMLAVYYTDFVTLFDGDSSYKLTVFNDSGEVTKSIIPWYTYTTPNTVPYIGDNGDGFISLFLIQPNGSLITTHVAANADFNNGNWDFFVTGNNRIVVTYFDQSSIFRTVKVLTTTGVLLDTLQTANYSNSYTISGFDTLLVRQDSTEGVEAAVWYFNNAVSTFTLIPTQANVFDYEMPFYDHENGIDTGLIAIKYVGIENSFIQILQPDSFISINLPSSVISAGARFGKNNFLYYYFTTTIVLELYDFNGNVVNSVTTELNSINSLYVSEDRYFTYFLDTGIYTSFMLATNGILETLTLNGNLQNAILYPNDYSWWND
jgi:hypothetical protein